MRKQQGFSLRKYRKTIAHYNNTSQSSITKSVYLNLAPWNEILTRGGNYLRALSLFVTSYITLRFSELSYTA